MIKDLTGLSYDNMADELDKYCDCVYCCDCPYFDAINYGSVEWESCLDYFIYRGFIPTPPSK